MKNITDLRATLFDTLEAIKAGKLDIDRAKAINEVAQTIINTAKAQTNNHHSLEEFHRVVATSVMSSRARLVMTRITSPNSSQKGLRSL